MRGPRDWEQEISWSRQSLCWFQGPLRPHGTLAPASLASLCHSKTPLCKTLHCKQNNPPQSNPFHQECRNITVPLLQALAHSSSFFLLFSLPIFVFVLRINTNSSFYSSLFPLLPHRSSRATRVMYGALQTNPVVALRRRLMV